MMLPPVSGDLSRRERELLEKLGVLSFGFQGFQVYAAGKPTGSETGATGETKPGYARRSGHFAGSNFLQSVGL